MNLQTEKNTTEKTETTNTENSETDNQKKDEVVETVPEPQLIYTGDTLLKLEKDEIKMVSYVINNFGNVKTAKVKNENRNVVLYSPLSCSNITSTMKKCTVKLTAKASGTSKLTFSLTNGSKFEISVTVEEPKEEVEVIEEEAKLELSSESATQFKNGIEAEVGQTVNLTIEKTSNVKIRTIFDISLISVLLQCQDTTCNLKVTGLKETSTDLKLLDLNGKAPTLTIPVKINAKTIVESNISDEVENNETNISDEIENIETNISIENNDSNLTDIQPTLSFGVGQKSNMSVVEGGKFIITTVLNNPRYFNETITASVFGKKAEIVSTVFDQSVSKENQFIFRTTIIAIENGNEQIIFRLKDSGQILTLHLAIESTNCGTDSSWTSVKSGENSKYMIFGAKLGYSNVEIFFPRIDVNSVIEPQNFIYISDDGNGSTVYNSSGTDLFAFFKFIETLEDLDFKIKYRKNNSTEIKCLNGIFPKRDLIETQEESVTIEEEAPTSPPDLEQ